MTTMRITVGRDSKHVLVHIERKYFPYLNTSSSIQLKEASCIRKMWDRDI